MSLVQCAKCMKEFDWNEAYKQSYTPGSHMHNPPGHGNLRPKAFCPHCGSLVAEWDIDRYGNRNRWNWYGKNVEVNSDREFPPSDTFRLWGRDIPPDACVTVAEDCIDVELVRQLLSEHDRCIEEFEKAEIRAEELSPEQILIDANEELDRFFKSRAESLNKMKEAFATLKFYIEGKGKSNAKAIALFGIINIFGSNFKRDEVRELFERAVTMDESCAICHLGLGILDYQNYDTAKRGVKRLGKAIALDSSLIDAYVWKARIQKQRINDPQGAWNTLKEAVSTVGEDQLKKHPRGHFLFLELGELCVYNNMGRLNDAIRYFETALQINPNSYEAPMYLMYIYQALGDTAEVVRTQAAYEKADRGLRLSSEAINTIQRFVAKGET